MEVRRSSKTSPSSGWRGTSGAGRWCRRFDFRSLWRPLITGDDPHRGSAGEESSLAAGRLWNGPGETEWRDLITPSPLFSLSCTLCNRRGDKGMIQAFHRRKCEKLPVKEPNYRFDGFGWRGA